MSKSLFAAIAIAALARVAAAESFTLPGTDLALTLPDGAYTMVDIGRGGTPQMMLAQLDRRALWSGAAVPMSCPDALAAAIRRSNNGTLEPAPEVPPGWSTQRVTSDVISVYCTERGAGRALIVIVISRAETDDQRIADARPLLGAVDAALAAAGTPPAPAFPATITIQMANVGALTLPGDHYVADGNLVVTRDGATTVSPPLVYDGSCAGWFQAPEATSQGPALGAPPDWYQTRASIGDETYFYCREQGNGRHLRVMVLSRSSDQAGDIGPVLQAMSAAFGAGASSAAASTYTPPPPPSYTPPPPSYAPPPSRDTSSADSSASSYTPPPASTTSAYEDREPATYDTARWGLAGGQSTLDLGATTHVYGAARVQLAPRYLEDDDDSGLVFGAGASAGAAGDAFVGDGYAGAGYGLSGSGLAARALIVAGLDRVGGGFEPQTGGYLGVEGFLRIGFGSVAFEGDGMVTTSSGVDETRAQVGAVTHVGDRVLAIDGFYQRWDGLAEIYGVSLGLTR